MSIIDFFRDDYLSALERERARLQGNPLPTVQVAGGTASAPGSSPNQSSWRTIFDAAARGTVQDVEHHLKSGVDINGKNNAGNTPLHSAAAVNPDAKVVQYLLDKGAKVDVKNNAGKTPMNVANTDEKRSAIFVATTGFKKSSSPYESPGKDIF